MLGAFAYLTLTSARNRFVRQLRRLRSPRYVVALLFAVAYFGFVFANPSSRGGAMSEALNPLVETLAALALVGLAVYWWVIGSDTGALAFSPAELQFLFPAPVTRRQLVQFKLIRAQLVILLNILIWSLLLRRGAEEGALAWVRPLSLWVLFSTMQLHRLGATLARTSAAEHGGAGLRRSAVAMGVVAIALGAIGYGFVREWPAAGLTLDTLRPTLEAATGVPPASWALAPVRVVVAPVFAGELAAWARAIPLAAALMLLHFVWVVRADAAFEDAAVEASAERAARAATRRGGGPSSSRRRGGAAGRRWLPLRPTGDPVVAILWKNMHAVTRGDRFVRQLLFFGVAVLGMSVVSYLRPERTAPFVLGIITAWGSLLVLLGPLWLRNDLRGDLPRLELLRTYPLPPARTVAAEIASSALVLTLLELALGVAVFVALLRAPGIELPLVDRVAIAAAAALALPAVNLLSASIHNASALLFPAWLPLGGDRKPGFEAMGQMYLTLFASMILLALLLALPVLVGAIAAYAFAPGLGAWRLVPAVVAGSLVAAGELALIIRWLGGVYARTEPADVVGA
jgi:hypothetical protein